MSWGQGSTRASRKARNHVLERDNHLCRIQLPGCTQHATEAHHLRSITEQGLRRSEAINPDSMVSACPHCHAQVTEGQRRAAHEAKQRYRNTRKHLPQRPHPGD